MSRPPIFLSLEQVLWLQKISLEEHGGRTGIRDLGAVEAAMTQPLNVWLYSQGDLIEIAAAYIFHLAQAQAFLDGNKRVGTAAGIAFLRLNGVTIPKNAEALHEALIAIAERRLDRQGLAVLLRRLADPTASAESP